MPLERASVHILIGETPTPPPSSRRAKHLRAGAVSEETRPSHTYVVNALDDGFAVVPYDRRGRPIRLHALGSATYPTIEAASAAIRSYEAREARSRAREE